jgi:hypothetical protein
MNKKFVLQAGRENSCCDIACRYSWEYNWISERRPGFVDWRYSITKNKVQLQVLSVRQYNFVFLEKTTN